MITSHLILLVYLKSDLAKCIGGVFGGLVDIE